MNLLSDKPLLNQRGFFIVRAQTVFRIANDVVFGTWILSLWPDCQSWLKKGAALTVQAWLGYSGVGVDLNSN